MLLASIATGSAVAPASGRAIGEIDRAREFLETAQLSTGTFPGLPILDTVEAARATRDAARRQSAAVALFVSTTDNSQAAFERLAALESTAYADPDARAAADELLARGAYGLRPEQATGDPLVMASALRYAMRTAQSGPASAIASQLAALASADGSFGFVDNDGDIALTGEVVRALEEAPGIPAASALAQLSGTWLASRATGDLSALPAADLALLVLAARALPQETVEGLTAAILARQGEDGGFDGRDVRATALAVQALERGLPDLRIRRPAIDLTEAVTGDPLVHTVLVANEGLVTSPATTIDFRLSSGGTQVLAGSLSVPAIAPGQTVTVSLDLGVQGPPGAYQVVAVVNPLPAFAEGDLDDNVLAYTLDVLDLADLVIEPVDIAVSPTPPMIGEANRVTVRVRNVGAATASNVQLQVFVGEPGNGGQLLGELMLNVVAPGTPRTLTAQFVPWSSTPVRLFARADPANAVREHDDANNGADVEVTPQNPAEWTIDLAPSTVRTSPTPSVAQGEPLAATYNVGGLVRRFGNPYPWVGLWPFQTVTVATFVGIPGAGGIEVDRREVDLFIYCDHLGCNDASSVTQTVDLPRDLPPGVHQITVVADPDQAIAGERDRANDVASVNVEILNDGLPDLVVASVSVDRTSVPTSMPSTLTARIVNSGVAAALDVPVSITMPNRVARQTIPLLEPNAGVDITEQVAYADLTPSAYQVTVRADPDGVVAESSESNNAGAVQMYQGVGDLKIDQVVQLVSPAPAGPTTPVEIHVRNDSAVSCGAWSVTVRTSPGGQLVGSKGLSIPDDPALEPGGTRIVTLDVQTSVEQQIAGMANEQSMVAAAISISCLARDASAPFTLHLARTDFAVTASGITLSPDPAAAGEPVTPTILVSNHGAIGAETSVRLYRGYPEQLDRVADGRLYVPAGGAAVFTGPPFVPRQEAPFVLTAIVDEENAWKEIDEDLSYAAYANNRATRTTLKPPGQVVVAFDEAHGPASTIADNPDANVGGITGGLSDFARDLQARGYRVVALNPDIERLAPAYLRGVDVLLAFAPTVAYTATELQLLRDTVEGGAGFLYLGDHREPNPQTFYPWGPPEDQIAATFGFTSNLDLPSPGGQCAVFQNYSRQYGDIRTHWITTGVNGISTQWGGTFGSLPAGAEILIQTPVNWQYSPDRTLSAAFPVGQGRMVIMGDANILDADFTGPSDCGTAALYYAGENARFGLQAVDWLAKGALADWKPDLAFNPSHLLVSQEIIDAGDRVTISATVRNTGGALGAGGDTVVRLYDGTPVPGNLIGERLVPALEIDQGYEVSFEWDTTGAAGSHVLTAVVDPDDVIDEFDEENNVITVAAEVRRSVDLRVDPSDIDLAPGSPPQVSVRIHNTGQSDTPAGARVRVQRRDVTGAALLADREVPIVPASQGVTIAFPWTGAFPAGSFDVHATVDPPPGRIDADPTTNEAHRDFGPPELELLTPLAGTRWGGKKSVRWSASSVTRPILTCSVQVAPSGGDFTGLPGTSCGAREIDTTKYPDGAYLVRVTAEDGLQTVAKEVPVTIANAATAVRTFGAGAGVASVTLASGAGSTAFRMPVGSHAVGATAVAAAVPTPKTFISQTPVYDSGGSPLVRHRGVLHVFYRKNTGGLWTRKSWDEGATWGAEEALVPSTVNVTAKAVDVNASGIHLVFNEPSGISYRRSADGVSWSTAVHLSYSTTSAPTVVALRATSDGLAMRCTYSGICVAVANADGSAWGPIASVNDGLAAVNAVVRGGKLHVVYGHWSAGFFYRAVDAARYGELKPNDPALQIIDNANGDGVEGSLITSREIVIARSRYPTDTWLLRCSLDRDCSDAREWLPEPPAISPYSANVFLAGEGGGIISMVQYVAGTTGPNRVFGQQGGAAWSTPRPLGGTTPSDPAYLIEDDALLGTGRYQGFEFYRWPGLTPADVRLDVGSEGTTELAVAGMLPGAVQLPDFAEAVNAYLASHADGDDGAVDGYVTVPISAVSAGAGQLELADLEIPYVQLTAVAGFAEPPLFSPTASPGVLDTTTLSTLLDGPIVVVDSSGAPRRTLVAQPVGGRYTAVFDGRDDGAGALPSGVYAFGRPGAPVATFEMDDVSPIATLRAGAEGSYGGLAPVHGVASDADWAGTPKNFARYVLEASMDGGSTWSTIAIATTPVDGVLGKWDTRRLTEGPATLRLTVSDRAGNATAVTRVVGVSPQAPIAPVIDSPTVAGTPLDATTATITVAGVAEPGTTVTVYVDGAASGTATSDGRWSVSGVPLPPGIATITADAARDGITSPRAQSITVARYGLAVALDAPDHVAGGTVAVGTVTLARTSVGAEPLTVRVLARDATGLAVEIGLSPSEQVVALPASGATSWQVQLGGAGVRAGTYTLQAEVVSGGLVPASAEDTVTFDPLVLVSASLVSDKAAYSSLQLAALTAQLLNEGTAYTGELLASITVHPPAAAPVVMGPYPVAPLAPSGSAAVGALYGSPPLEVGAYTAELLVTDALANVLATALTTFEVRAAVGPTELAGTLTATPLEYAIGDPVQVAWSVTNGGSPGLVDVSVLLVRPSDGLVIARHDESVTLGIGASAAGVTVLSTAPSTGGDLIAILLGNGLGLAAESLAEAPFVDTEPPAIAFSGFADGEYRSGSVTPVVTISDASPFTSETWLDGQPFTSGTVVDAEGPHTVAVHAVDALGNVSDASSSFTIDTVAPVIAIGGVVDGALIATTVLPTVEVTESYPASQTVLLDGTAWDGLPVTTDGVHVLSVHAEDLAGNVADAGATFAIDRTAPVIAVSGVEPGVIYASPVQPVATVTDAHPLDPAWTAMLNGVPWTGAAVSTEGSWSLVVSASDAAGNAAEPVSVAFAVDLTAPVITVTGVVDGLLTNEVVTPFVTIQEANQGTQTVLLDGSPFVSGTPVVAEGDHVLTATATDAAGNTTGPVSISFTRDVTPPAITIGGVTEGATYYVDATPTFSVTDLHPGAVSALLDGSPFASGATVTTDGVHTLEVSSTDLADNTASSTISFRVVVVQTSIVASVDSAPRVLAVVNCEGQPVSCRESEAGVLMGALDAAGIGYEIALDPTTFLQKLRENKHNVRILYRAASSATNALWELRELTYEGGGLLHVNDGSPDADPKLKETIGVSFLGNVKTIGSLNVTNGDLGPDRSFAVSGPGVAQSLQSPTATVVGVASGKNGEALATTNRYGLGRAVTLTFNPEVNDNQDMKDLLVQAIRFASGGSLVAGVPGAPQYVKLECEMTSPAGPLDFQLDAWTGAGLVPLTDGGTPTTPPRTWTFPLTAGASVSRTLGVSSGQKGTYALLGELGLKTGPTMTRLVGSASLDVTVTGSIAELKANAVAAALAIPAGINDSAKSAAIAHLTAVDPAPLTKSVCSTAITGALEATDDLKLINGIEAADARVKTDQLLRALQVLFTTLP